ncbi:MAG: hypothetical protein ACRYGM_15390 [Janthinobacterium lividum]
MSATSPVRENTMREQPAEVRAWLRCDLTRRYGAVLNEDLPLAMIELLSQPPTYN